MTLGKINNYNSLPSISFASNNFFQNNNVNTDINITNSTTKRIILNINNDNNYSTVPNGYFDNNNTKHVLTDKKVTTNDNKLLDKVNLSNLVTDNDSDIFYLRESFSTAFF